jgi:hypothetical protein
MSSGHEGPAGRAGAAGDRHDRGGAWAPGGTAQEAGDEDVIELAGDAALEAADDLGLGLAFGGAALGVGAGAVAVGEVVCPCTASLALGADYDRCNVTLVFHIVDGEVEGTDVSGLTVAAIADSPKVMSDGNWRLEGP